MHVVTSPSEVGSTVVMTLCYHLLYAV